MIINNTYGHGGDIYKNEIELDFSVNINPFGTPPEVVEAAAKAAADMAAYPDPYCGKLRDKLAEKTGADARHIICGNGAAELIFQFVQALKPAKTLLPEPSFSEYESALDAAGCEIVHFRLLRENGFALQEDFPDRITKDISLLMLCSPNNPTGVCIPEDLLYRILEKCRKTGTWLFLDECFLDLSDAEKAASLIPVMKEGDRAFVLKAFTKMYGMAGVRLGYGICKNTEMTDRMCGLIQPWNVSCVAQAAGIAALSLKGWPEKTRKVIAEEKAYLVEELKELGISVLPSDTNFLLLSGMPGLYEKLLEKKILIRRCANYHGLDDGDCRIAVRTHAENERLIAALKEVMHA